MKVELNGATLIYGDAVTELQALSKHTIRCVFTDPPYKIISGGNTSGLMQGGIFDPLVYSNNGNLVNTTLEWHKWVKYLHIPLQQDADVYVMTNDKNMQDALNAFINKNTPYKLHNILIWNKQSPTPNRWYMKDAEFILYFWQGRAIPIHNKGSKQINHLPLLRGNRKVPTEKPLHLSTTYIANSTVLGDTVLDPFMGSGTFIESALRLERRAVGIEKDKDTFEIAVERIRSLT